MLGVIALLWCLMVWRTGAEVLEHTYGSPDYREEPYSIAALPDGGFIVVGERSLCEPFPYQQGFRTLERKLYLLRLDAFGDTLWTKVYEESPGSPTVAAIKDGGFVIVNSSDDKEKGLSAVHIMCFNAQGDTLWTRMYTGDCGVMGGGEVVVLPNGDFVLTGHAFASLENITEGAGAFLLCMGFEGQFRWMRTYTYTKEVLGSIEWINNDGRYLALLPDGGFIVAGGVYYPLNLGHQTVRTYAISKRIYLLRTDSKGNPIWEKRYGQEGMMVNAGDIAPAPDGGFWVVGSKVLEKFKGNPQAYLLRLDASGKVLWDRTYEKVRGICFVTALPDSGCLLAGNKGGVFLMRLDAQGNKLWSRSYREDVWIHFGLSLPDGDIALVGSKAAQQDINGLDIYLMLLDVEEFSEIPTVEEE